jgi:hypothetical protein
MAVCASERDGPVLEEESQAHVQVERIDRIMGARMAADEYCADEFAYELDVFVRCYRQSGIQQ